MTRRDMIILAVLVNTGLLTIIFMMAIISSDDPITTKQEESILVQKKSQSSSQTPIEIPITYQENPKNSSTNSLSIAQQTQEILVEDTLIYMDHEEDYNSETEHSMIVSPTISQVKIGPPSNPKTNISETSKISQDNEKKISITVKSGDTLDKIARANGTTVAILRESNHLKSDRLNIGQILQIPIKCSKEEKDLSTAKTTKTEKIESKSLNRIEPEFYTVKNGDNPTKIAKLFQIKVEDIIRLNNMTVERSRNLKVGERIRIK